eukprot:TRINITY_DN10819_c0_g1_i1.p1 TRINITY_DN10819_c0_g1~~TRINITY_DN10819_c0_g1_i1.p1  ORF type:complete len:257 (-),score=65.43 TRINITY_DN10819_c0_g1_i1:51-821(-)
MPGPMAHTISCGLQGVALLWASGGRFSVWHVAAYSLCGFFGPDAGAFVAWLCETLLGPAAYADVAASFAMQVLHSPVWFVPTLGLLEAWCLSRLSRGRLRFPCCLTLVAAGSLAHFSLDWVFEENGEAPVFKWVLSTGYWTGPAATTPAAVVVAGSLLVCLYAGFALIHQKSERKSWSPGATAGALLLLLGAVCTAYLSWFAWKLYGTQPRAPVMGEEADLGVIVFELLFRALPLLMCVASTHLQDRTAQLVDLLS